MTKPVRFLLLLLLIPALLAIPSPGMAELREYHLTIAKGKVNLTGQPADAMTVNGGIPGPTLRFTEGDTARIHVTNRMDVNTSVHWHGLLVPPGMDGVPDISFPPIAPGTTFTYEFPIRQSGTYWYHSHTRLQEQSGVYGSIVITPPGYKSPADRELVLVLSDWTNDSPGSVMQALKRGSEFFSVQKGSAQSLIGAAALGRLGDYTMRDMVRMPPMDIADVAYDRFLINGKPMQKVAAQPGQSFRLRVINGSASSFFYVEFAGGPLTILSADGQEVEPIQEKRLLIGVAETYDLLVKLPAQAGSYEFRATAQDGSSWAALWLGKGAPHPAPAIPRPDLYLMHGTPSLGRILALTPAGSMGMPDSAVEAGKFDKPGMAGMGDMKMDHGTMKNMAMDQGKDKAMDMGGHGEMKTSAQPKEHGKTVAQGGHGDMKMPAPVMTHGKPMSAMAPSPPPSGKRWSYDFAPLASDVSASPSLARDGGPERPWPPYAKLKAKHSTALAKGAPVRDIRLTLDGDMERYVWLLNNKPLSESDVIRIKKGETVRFIMINRTMMHHPMHLHGHFFRVINGQGERAPLKHTVDVAPMSTTVIEFKADEFGDWFFHCHLLYHMKAGMARLVHYEGFVPPAAVQAVRPRLYAESWYPMVEGSILSNMSEGKAQIASTRNVIGVEWEIGWQRRTKAEWEAIPTWAYHVNRFFSAFAGAHMEGESGTLDKTRGIVGINYLLPYNLHSMFWVDTDLGGRVELARVWDLTPRLALFGTWRYDTHDFWEAEAGLSYMINSHLSVVGQWHSEYGWGAGLGFSF